MRLSGKRLVTLDGAAQTEQETIHTTFKPHWVYLAVAVYGLIFLALRLLNLTDFPLNVDERRHIIRAQITLAEGDIFIGMRESLKQLYIWWLALVLPFFQDHIFAARFAGVLTGLGTTAVCYKVGRSLFTSRRIGWLAALFYLISPMALFYDRLAYTDTLLTMLMGLGILLSFQLWRTPTVKWAIALGLVFGLAALAKVYAALYYPAPILVWFLLGREVNWPRALKLLTITYGTAFLLWLPIIIVGLNIFQEDHTQKLITDLPTETWLETITGNIEATVVWLGGYLTIPFAVLFIGSLGWLILKRNKTGWVLAILIGIHTLTFILLLRYGAARYLLPLLVPISVIIAWGVSQVSQLVSHQVGSHLSKAARSASPTLEWGLSIAIILLLGLPALHFDYLIVTDVAAAALPGEDRWIFVEGRFSGYGLKESAEVVATMADQYPELIVLQGTNLMDTVFSLDVIGMSVYLQDKANITYKQIGDFGPQALQTLDTYAHQAPVLTLGTFDEEGEPLPMFEPILNHPRAWRIASFSKPGQRHKVALYQWLLWPDFAVRWLQQGGDPDPHIALAPVEGLVTATGGTLRPWPQNEEGVTTLSQSDIEYVFLDAGLVQSQPDRFAPFVSVEGTRLRFTQPPPDWYLAFAYPGLACERCLFYVRPPAIPTQITFANAIQLDGYDLSATSIAPGDSLHLTLFWQSLTSPPESLVAFAHLLDEQNRLVAQVDQRPLQGQWPTHAWQPGSKVADRYTLPLDPTLPAGEYRLLVGWYQPETLERLPVHSADRPVSNQAVQLATLRVE